jgi:hypothetical protein
MPRTVMMPKRDSSDREDGEPLGGGGPARQPGRKAAGEAAPQPGPERVSRGVPAGVPAGDKERDRERRSRRAAFLRELSEARALRERVQPRRARSVRLRRQMRMRTFRW